MYIRTKDGVYEVIKEILDGEAYEVKVPQSKWEYDEDNKCYYEDSKIDGFCKKDIIKQSENIEELCDEFVVECFNKSYHAISEIGYDELKHNTQTLNPTDTIYGAIWTEWGLKYVAKMNENGELKLI